ncbi:MAG: MerR family transcriptional regulator [Thermomicrobiales bacterium]|nr:MAG: MerR family transcriptional regulator [Thermomicrobiales bacterium]
MEHSLAHDRNRKLLSIGEVVALLRASYPDVTHSSLRFLEREGLITATRTPGGHRLYTQDDVERIRQIKAWQAQRLTLEAIRERLARLDRLPPASWLASEFLRLAVAGDFLEATRLILSIDDVGFPLTRMFGDILRPVLVDVGQQWKEGLLLVAQEKEISQCIRDVIAELILRHSPSEAHGPALVAACVHGERHELGLYMICGLLRCRGHRIYYLGPDVAPEFLLDAVRLHQPALVLLSSTLPQNLPAVHQAIITVRDALNDSSLPLMLAGGQAVTDNHHLVSSWGAIPVAEDLPDHAVQVIEELLAARAAPPSVNGQAAHHA